MVRECEGCPCNRDGECRWVDPEERQRMVVAEVLDRVCAVGYRIHTVPRRRME